MNCRLLARLAPALLLLPAIVRAQSASIVGTITVASASITGIVVYLVPSPLTAAPDPSPVSADVDQHELRFMPPVVAVTPGSTVFFTNSDSVLHNVFHPPRLFRGGFDLGTFPPGERRSFTFSNEGAFVILCRVHPEMVGYVVVVASPYRAVSDDEGHFRIQGVAPGTYTLQTWHARLRSHQEVVTVPGPGTLSVDLSLTLGHPEDPTAKRQPEE
jgi:plastocyanin